MHTGFDVFSALDGPCLNGPEGPAGVLSVSFCSHGPDELKSGTPKVRYFNGAAGGHAVQLKSDGTIGFLGGFRGTGVFFTPATLEPIARFWPDNFHVPLDVDLRSQTHVVFARPNDNFIPPDSFITAIGPNLHQIPLKDFSRAELLGGHGVGLPHAIKRSASGRYLFMGAMDTVPGQRARMVGVFDLKDRIGWTVPLNRTAWHVQPHPTEDVFYAVTENYEDDPRGGRLAWYNFSIPVEANYLWKIAANGTVLNAYALGESEPSHLSSDIVVLGDADDTVLYNSCASSTITMVKLARDWHEYVEEGVWPVLGPHPSWKHPGVWRSFWRNLREVRQRNNLLTNLHLLGRARYITRGTLVDGSYGLSLSPDGHWLISAHRGLNEFLVYRYPDVLERGADALAYRVPLPPAYRYLRHAADRRLGLHHNTLTTALVNPGECHA